VPSTLPRALMTINPPPTLSPHQRLALTAATWALHRWAWKVSGEAICLDDCETIAANVVLTYLKTLDAHGGER